MRKLVFVSAIAVFSVVAQNLIREEQTIVVNGVRETWRLEWKFPPKPECDDEEMALTMPCKGFAYGQIGILDLVRLRCGTEVERLPLTQFFEGGHATIRHRALRRGPVVKVMNFADYNHDGNATEFYLQTSAFADHTDSIVLGVSRDNPKLHAFGSTLQPDKPLVLQPEHWNALLKSHGPVHVEDWLCGDHGSDVQVELQLPASPRGIEVIREGYACPRPPGAQPIKKETQ